MCGIAAVAALRGLGPSAELLQAMGAVLRHRGPDGEGTVTEGPVGLFHARLAVIDLVSGAQPMRRDALLVTYNGEIYNYRELRAELESHGHRFRTASDTEVLLAAYAQWGDDCVTHLNGMFAFVLYDRAAQRVLAARDRFGIKPLYWARTRDAMIWASEAKALLRHPELRAALDREGLEDYLTFQFTLGERTLFAGVSKLPPAHLQVLELGTGTLRTRRYWTLHYPVRDSLGESEAVEELQTLLADAVRLQLRSDVPVGTHLSGGMDSSLITALASQALDAPGPAFTGTYREGPEFDETPYARAVAAATGVELVEVEPSSDGLSELLPRLVWHLDEPAAGPGLLPQYAVSAAAARRVKVVLAGQGGDEVFGGYTRYLVAYLEQALKGAIYETNEEAEHIVSLHSILPNLPHLQRYVPMLQQFWRQGVFEPMDRRYFRLVDRLGGATSIFTEAFRATYDREAAFARFQELFAHPETRSYYNKMTHFDLQASLPALLQVEDRTSMAVGLESRVPLLDHRLVEFVATLAPRLKFRGGEMKYILKRAARGRVPDQVLDRRDKMGFPVPWQRWSSGPAREFIRDTLSSQRARERGIVDARAVERLLAHEQPFSRQSWGLLNLELWFQTFVDL